MGSELESHAHFTTDELRPVPFSDCHVQEVSKMPVRVNLEVVTGE